MQLCQSLCLKGQIHTSRNIHFWYRAFHFYSHEIHKTLAHCIMYPVLTFTPDIFSHYSLSLALLDQAGGSFFFSFSDWFLHQTSLPIIKRLQYMSDYQVWQRESNFVNVRKREWLVSKQRQSWDDNPLSVVGSALTVFDDDKLIHKSNLVFNNVFNGQSNRSIFICSSSFSMSQWNILFSTQVDIINPKGKKIRYRFCVGGKKLSGR